MGIIKFILVLLLCVPIAFLLWRAVNTLLDNLEKQRKASEEVRIRKAEFQGSRRYSGGERRRSGSRRRREESSRARRRRRY